MDCWIELVGLASVSIGVLLEAGYRARQGDVREARARPASQAKRCPYCHEDLASAEAPSLVCCARCATPHHAACWEDAPRCSVYGCGSDAQTDGPTATPAREVPAEGAPAG